ncbi:MAG: hypothetical protein U0528_21285 [Anaerolineae bacterium]
MTPADYDRDQGWDGDETLIALMFINIFRQKRGHTPIYCPPLTCEFFTLISGTKQVISTRSSAPPAGVYRTVMTSLTKTKPTSSSFLDSGLQLVDPPAADLIAASFTLMPDNYIDAHQYVKLIHNNLKKLETTRRLLDDNSSSSHLYGAASGSMWLRAGVTQCGAG